MPRAGKNPPATKPCSSPVASSGAENRKAPTMGGTGSLVMRENLWPCSPAADGEGEAMPCPLGPVSELSLVCLGCGPRQAEQPGGKDRGPGQSWPRSPGRCPGTLGHLSQGLFCAGARMGPGTRAHPRTRTCPRGRSTEKARNQQFPPRVMRFMKGSQDAVRNPCRLSHETPRTLGAGGTQRGHPVCHVWAAGRSVRPEGGM